MEIASQMSDRRAIFNMCMVIANMACYNLYFYELFWGSWNEIHTRAFYYGVTSVMMIYLFIDDFIGYSSITHRQLNLIAKAAITVNFILFTLILKNLLPNPIMYLFLLNGSIFVISCIILFSGLSHGYFKKHV